MFSKEYWLYFKTLNHLLIFLPNVLCDNKCWVTFDAKEHFEIMDELDERYAEVRENYQNTFGTDYDHKMLQAMLMARSIAERAAYAADNDLSKIPAGINLGGYSMMRLTDSILFFHRMKLRNDTQFQVMSLKNDLANLMLKTKIRLNDLHLFGSYDRTFTDKEDSSLLFYVPTFGQVEFLLQNVTYHVEGRYRLLESRLNIEIIVSKLEMEDLLMMYKNINSTHSIRIETKNIDTFVETMKTDLDRWLKDYFNDYLMYFVVAGDPEFEKYNQEKTIALNNYTDKVIEKIIRRLNEFNASAVHVPNFTLQSINGVEIRLRDGVLRGLDTMYRRSITTGNKKENVRNVDTVVAFSNLKLTYRYDASTASGLPAVTGLLLLSADELTASMGLSLIKEPEFADLSFTFLQQAKAESLTVEGPANRMISNFKYLLERHIIALMTNGLVHTIKLLGSLDRCVPLLTP